MRRDAGDASVARNSAPRPADEAVAGGAKPSWWARSVDAIRRYPLVAGTIVVGIGALLLVAIGVEPAARVSVSVYSTGIALFELWKLIRKFTKGSWGLDVLAVAAIGSTVLTGDYWASIVVVLMVTGGEALEQFAAARARGALTELMSRAPRFAHRLTAGAEPSEIAINDVVVGDELFVKPGETVPVDVELLEAEADFDESSLTGESLPRRHSRGEIVLSGSVNGSTGIRVRAAAAASVSQYQQIITLVEAASESKAPFVRLADRYAIPFTIIAFAIAAVAWAVSGEPVRFAEVMVVATPCPLLIAAPVAFIAGMNRAAKAGVIIRNGASLEQLARVTAVAFDKTGTLTHGVPAVDRVDALGAIDAADVVTLAAAVESGSAHILAHAVVEGARALNAAIPQATRLTEVTGRGVEATVGGRLVRVGRAEFVDQLHPVEPWQSLRALAAGELAIFVSVDGEAAGRIVLRDEIRANARQTIARLARLGVAHTVMLTGDAPQTAGLIAGEAGITDIRSSLLPGQKVAALGAIGTRPIAMVGDGVNDAPVLAAADVGLAMGARGATAASETADVVILRDDLGLVAEVIAIAQRTIRVAVQSIAVGIALSLGLMIVASFGLIPSIVGATLQELVDLATILNGLRAVSAGRSRILR